MDQIWTTEAAALAGLCRREIAPARLFNESRVRPADDRSRPPFHLPLSSRAAPPALGGGAGNSSLSGGLRISPPGDAAVK